jgi:cytochrome c
VLPTADYLELPRYRDANLEYGNNLVMQCRTCHGFERGAAGLGPSLFGVFGRKAGSVDGYPYSPALADASFYWTPRALDAWLAQPGRFLPGNSMAYAGLRNREDRDALIASLLRLTEPPLPAEGG